MIMVVHHPMGHQPLLYLVQTETEDSPIHVITQNQKGELSIVLFSERTLLVDPGGFDILFFQNTENVLYLKNTSVVEFTLSLLQVRSSENNFGTQSGF